MMTTLTVIATWVLVALAGAVVVSTLLGLREGDWEDDA